MIRFREKLRELRIENKMSQKQLATQLGLSEKTISHYESGYSEPSLLTLVSISKFFDVSVGYLLGIEDL